MGTLAGIFAGTGQKLVGTFAAHLAGTSLKIVGDFVGMRGALLESARRLFQRKTAKQRPGRPPPETPQKTARGPGKKRQKTVKNGRAGEAISV